MKQLLRRLLGDNRVTDASPFAVIATHRAVLLTLDRRISALAVLRAHFEVISAGRS